MLGKLAEKYLSFFEIKMYTANQGEKENIKFKEISSRDKLHQPNKLYEEDNDQDDCVFEWSKEVELLHKGENVNVALEHYISNSEIIKNEDDMSNTDPQDVNSVNLSIDCTEPVDLQDIILESLQQYESFIYGTSSERYQPISRDIKIVMKQIMEINITNLCMEESLEPSLNSLPEDLYVHESNVDYTPPTDLVKEEFNEIVLKEEHEEKEELFKVELFDSKHSLQELRTRNIDESVKIKKKNDTRNTSNNGFFNDCVKEAANSILNGQSGEFNSEEFRVSHLEQSQSEPVYFSCTRCPFKTELMVDYMVHVNVVHPIVSKEGTFAGTKDIHKCNICDHSTDCISSLRSHTIGVHVNNRGFKCNLCKFTSNFKSGLTSHFEIVHMKLKKYHCDFCDFSTSTRHQLNNHLQCVHSNQKKFKCHLCNYTAALKRYLRRHLAVHSNEKRSTE